MYNIIILVFMSIYFLFYPPKDGRRDSEDVKKKKNIPQSWCSVLNNRYLEFKSLRVRPRDDVPRLFAYFPKKNEVIAGDRGGGGRSRGLGFSTFLQLKPPSPPPKKNPSYKQSMLSVEQIVP